MHFCRLWQEYFLAEVKTRRTLLWMPADNNVLLILAYLLLFQEFAITLLSHYSHRYATSLWGGHLLRPLYDRHAPRTLCLCQFIEREFFHVSRDSINTVSWRESDVTSKTITTQQPPYNVIVQVYYMLTQLTHPVAFLVFNLLFLWIFLKYQFQNISLISTKTMR